MADIELVIRIPEEIYDTYMNYSEGYVDFLLFGIEAKIAKAIRNGKPLLKGHGAIKDIDAIISEHAMTKYDWNDCVDIDDLKNAPTIIEADKEQE